MQPRIKKIENANEKNETQTPLLSLESVQEEVAEILSSNLDLVYSTVLEKVQRVDKMSIKIQGRGKGACQQDDET